MIDFEDLIKKKARNTIIAICLGYLLVLLMYFQIQDDSAFFFMFFAFLLLIYVFFNIPYLCLQKQRKISKMIYEKIQYRTEILKAINPSYNYDCEVIPFLNCHFFIKEQEIQNNVNSILEDSIVADDVKSNLKQVQREINKLLDTYSKGVVQICSASRSMCGKYFDKKINPVYRFFSDEDIEFFYSRLGWWENLLLKK